jgi:hypothetical protein
MRLGGMAVGITGQDGVAPPTPSDSAIEAARIARLVADLVEPARAEALEDLGEGQRAFGIATSWVRGRLGQ